MPASQSRRRIGVGALITAFAVMAGALSAPSTAQAADDTPPSVTDAVNITRLLAPRGSLTQVSASRLQASRTHGSNSSQAPNLG